MRTLRRFWQHAANEHRRFGWGIVLLLATNALGLSIPWLLRAAVHGIERGVATAQLARFALAIVAVAVVQAVIRTGSRLVLLGASRQIVARLRAQYFAQLQRLSARYYDTHRTGDLMSRGISDILLLRSVYGPGVLNLINTVIVYLAALTLMMVLNPKLTLVALLLYPPLLLAVNRINRRAYARGLAVQEAVSDLTTRAQENLSGIQQVRIYGQEAREERAFAALSARFRRSSLALVAAQGAMVALIGVTAGAATLIVLFVGGRAVVAGEMTLGDFVAFQAYLAQLAWPTVAFGWILNVFQRGVGALDRLDEVFHESAEIPPPDPAVTPRAVAGTIEVRGLTFRYRPEGPDVLRDVDLRLPPGQRVALVGAVGAGKSTLAALLARIYAAPPGTIRLDGQPIEAIPIQDWRHSIGLVPQESFLFSRTLRENISLNRALATEPRVMRAVQIARLDRDLAQLPHGLDTVVGERGVTLSGGQRQRAALARAICTEPPLLILDDPLAAVDANTEHAILAELESLPQRTMLLISHRMTTLAGVDWIYVLEQGRVVEEGRHSDLLAAGGVYARLFNRQALERALESP